MTTTETRAVIFDIDGTAMANVLDARPSPRVITAVARAQNKGISLSCATGRNNVVAQHILDDLKLRDPCIVGGGTQIINPESGEELWSEEMSEDTVRHCLGILSPYRLKILVDGDTHETALTADRIVPKSYRMLDVQHARNEDAIKIIEDLTQDTSIAVMPVHSSDEETSFLHITDKLATKEFAVIKLLELIGIDKRQAAGVGDGLNDLELFKAVGIKVAMGNAVDQLKQSADIVLPTVDEDGLAVYLEELADG